MTLKADESEDKEYISTSIRYEQGLYKKLKALAQKNYRTLQAQITMMLEQKLEEIEKEEKEDE